MRITGQIGIGGLMQATNPSRDINWVIEQDELIEYMSPKEYFGYCHGLSVYRNDTSQSAITNYMRQMKKGLKIYPPSLLFEQDELVKQDGRHRVIAAENLGIKQIPINMVYFI